MSGNAVGVGEQWGGGGGGARGHTGDREKKNKTGEKTGATGVKGRVDERRCSNNSDRAPREGGCAVGGDDARPGRAQRRGGVGALAGCPLVACRVPHAGHRWGADDGTTHSRLAGAAAHQHHNPARQAVCSPPVAAPTPTHGWRPAGLPHWECGRGVSCLDRRCLSSCTPPYFLV